MKLIEALQEKGNPYWIPDCKREDLPAFFKELGLKRGVEVGVFHGDFLVEFCKKGFEMTGIDPWTDEEMNTARQKLEPAETTYQKAIEILKPYGCKLIKENSMSAVKYFEDNSLDFVYIDANHTFGHVAMDLMIWSEKVKVGGIISGHDYYTDDERHKPYLKHSGDAIDAFAKSYGFTNWYVVGGKEAKEGERRDKSLSFFMIKQ
jgi:hypothetical protein